MVYTIKDIDKIISFKSWSIDEKIDELLRIDCDMYCNIGTESTKKTKAETQTNSRKIYLLIKKMNPELGVLFLNN
jgi:hypothetical protein